MAYHISAFGAHASHALKALADDDGYVPSKGDKASAFAYHHRKRVHWREHVRQCEAETQRCQASVEDRRNR